MKKKLFYRFGFDLISTRGLPSVIKIGLLTSKNIRKSLPEELANFSGNGYFDQIKSEFKEPIHSFHYLAEICAIHSVNIIMLLRELRTSHDLKESFEMRFTIFFDLYFMISLERRLRKAFHFWPRWPRVKGSRCFGFYDSSVLFSMLEFCSDLEVCFMAWIFDVSDGKVKSMMCKTVDLKFVDWICKVGMFKQFFCGVGHLNFFPEEVISDKYDLKDELDKIIGNLRYECYEYEELMEKSSRKGQDGEIRIDPADFKKSKCWKLLQDLLDDDLRQGIVVNERRHGKHQPQTLRRILRKKAKDKRNPRPQYVKIAENIKPVGGKNRTYKLGIPYREIDCHRNV